MDATKLNKLIWFGGIQGPTPYEFIGFRATIISHTPVGFLTAITISTKPTWATSSMTTISNFANPIPRK